jgi:hypothetical protein
VEILNFGCGYQAQYFKAKRERDREIILYLTRIPAQFEETNHDHFSILV